ncbi:MAG: cadmium-translocating P-type ATPase [Bacilli bacterium]|nr:cadmium-translocating P-type ATPase [Bacilli bacterium]
MEAKFNVNGMSCAACQAHVDKAVSSLKGVKICNVNLLTNSMYVEWDEKIVDVKKIELAVKKAGYSASLKSIKSDHESAVKLVKLCSSIFVLLLLMYISMGHMFGAPIPPFIDPQVSLQNARWFCLIQLILTSIVISIYFVDYYFDGFKKLVNLKPNMNSLIAVGSLASFVYGIVITVQVFVGVRSANWSQVETLHMNLYFESAAMILVFVAIGKYLESLSKKKTTEAIKDLIELAPQEAFVIRDDVESLVSIDDVKIGDTVVVRKGERIPVDGEVIGGSASVDEATITGESAPAFKNVSSSVYSSTIVTSGFLKIKAVKVGEDTSINSIVKLVEEASNSKAPISKLADKVSLYFVPIVFGISLLTFLVWMVISRDFATSFNYGISVLVIACPCALGLATPVAIMVGSGRGAKEGILIKNAEILEKTHGIRVVLLDKTGTLTEGKPSVTDCVFISKSNCLPIVRSIEKMSEHPLSNAIVEYCPDFNDIEVSDYKNIEGVGVSACVNGVQYLIGNKKILVNDLPDEVANEFDKFSSEGKTVLFVTADGALECMFAIKDKLKKSSKDAVSLLSKMGIKVIMLTGDNEATAKAIALEAGIDEVIPEVLPNDKGDIVKRVKNETGLPVAMVGDGVNDSIALACADVGIALGAGSDVALDSSDIVLQKNDLLDIANSISLSRSTIRTIKLGLFWAFFYNCICVIIATGAFAWAGVKINPMIGSAAMSISSVFVVLNALTLNLWKPKNNKIIDINKGEKTMETIELSIKGMMCEMCVKHVTKALESVPGVSDVKVSLKENYASVIATGVSRDELVKAVVDAGYECK